jgi:hypothetical protein
MGGYGTWHYGGHQADVFAGLVSGAGGILKDSPVNGTSATMSTGISEPMSGR